MQDSDGSRKKTQKKKIRNFWVIKIIIATFFISITFSLICSKALSDINIYAAIVILLVIIATGILFDIIGVSVTAATEIQFHSMAAKKVAAASQAISLIRNAEKVSNFCNDVIGDICGIISGSTGSVIVAHIVTGDLSGVELAVSVITTGLIASLTVGGKAAGKRLALAHSNEIIYMAARVISFFKGNRTRKEELR